MDIILIILIIFAVSLVLAIFRIARYGPTIQSLTSAIVAGAIFTLVLFVYLDVTDFRNNFEDSEKLFLLQDESRRLVAGFSGVLAQDSVPEFLDAQTLARKQAEYDANDVEALVGSYYKVFVVSEGMFGSFQREVAYGNMTLSREETLDLIRSAQPASDLAQRYLRGLSVPDPTGALKAQVIDGLREQAPDDASMRGLLFANLFSASFASQGPNFLVFGIASDQVKVFKETPLFLLIRYTPPFLLEQVAQTEEDDEPA